MRRSESNLVNDISALCRGNVVCNTTNTDEVDSVIKELHIKYNLRRSVLCNIKSTPNLIGSIMDAILVRHKKYARGPAGKRKYSLSVDIKSGKYYGISVTVRPRKLYVTIRAGLQQTEVEYELPLTPCHYDKLMLGVMPTGMKEALLSPGTDNPPWSPDYLTALA